MSNLQRTKPLFIFEMANNHMGNVTHGLAIVERFRQVVKPFSEFSFGFKFQYRNLDTFIHPDYKGSTEYKYVKRFSETRLNKEEFKQLKDALDEAGFVSICTPFDEVSVDLIEEHNYQFLKIASCSLTDWPLLERVALTDGPIIASTAGALLEDIDKVVLFFEHRQKALTLMHCVGAYPTPEDKLELNQIAMFKARYPGVPIGYSTHEDPNNTDAVKMAIAMGASVFERHVGLPTDAYGLNAYSSSPEQVETWLKAAARAFTMCGVVGQRRPISDKERADLRGLQRGVFVREAIKAGQVIDSDKVFYAIPNQSGQLVANTLSKYVKIVAKNDIAALAPVVADEVTLTDSRERILSIIKKVKQLVLESGIKLQNKIDFELSHHYGLDQFDQFGCTIMNIINRAYCKKLILLFAGQENPTHTHKSKEETFHILYGEGWINVNGKITNFSAGDLLTVERHTPHSFGSPTGAILEEVSTTHQMADSFYEDAEINASKDRKTYMTFWIDWLDKPLC